jgi:hypothetical protein
MPHLNPRVQRDDYRPFVGKKVMIGTRSYHYLCGRAEAIDVEHDRLQVRVAGREIFVPLDEVATIQEAPEAQAEYIK